MLVAGDALIELQTVEVDQLRSDSSARKNRRWLQTENGVAIDVAAQLGLGATLPNVLKQQQGQRDATLQASLKQHLVGFKEIFISLL